MRNDSNLIPTNPHIVENWLKFCEVVSKDYRPWKGKEIEITTDICPEMDLQQYLNRPIHCRSFNSVQLTIREELMMSITPFELQSHVNPILWATGNVLVAGLGLGYYLNQIKNKESVRHILVLEKEQEVIEAYLAEFGQHPKIRIQKCDIFEFRSNEKWDFFYADIWPIFEFKETIDQTCIILTQINCYHWAFWGIEYFLLNEALRLHQPIGHILKTYNLEWMQQDIIELEHYLTPR